MGNKSHKDNMKPYLKQKSQSWNLWQRFRFQVQQFFQQHQAEYWTLMVQEEFEKILGQLGVEMNHKVVVVRDCHWEGEYIVYCRK